MKVTKASLGIGDLHFSNSPARRHTKKQLRGAVRQTSPSISIHMKAIFYEVTKERHSLRTASRLSLNILRFESDLCELNRL